MRAWRWVRGFLGRQRPVRLVVGGYALYVLIGFGLLCLPWAQEAEDVAWLDHLFIATSAVSTTGLASIQSVSCSGTTISSTASSIASMVCNLAQSTTRILQVAPDQERLFMLESIQSS